MRTQLRHILLDHPGPDWRVAQKMGIPDSRLSKIASGQVQPTKEEKQRLSEILGKPIPELFPGDSENGNSGFDS